MVRAKADCLFNSKSEFHKAPSVRVIAQTGLPGRAGGQEPAFEAGRLSSMEALKALNTTLVFQYYYKRANDSTKLIQ